MRSLILLSAAAAAAMAGGYAIPENSVNSTALSAAYVANAHGADAAYFNPAAMVYNDDANLLEVDATYIGLTKIQYKGDYTHPLTGPYTDLDIRSKGEDFLVPAFHFTSKKLGESGARVGLSIVSPAGLSKRWNEQPAKATAEEFTLKTVEVNPSMAISLGNNISFGAGFRIVKTDGIVKSTTGATQISRNLEGDAIDYGYNLALMYKPLPELNLAATYRSRVNLNVEGSAVLNYLPSLAPGHDAYSGEASVSVPVPASLNLAMSYTFATGTTVEAVYQRTYWSAYKDLDFNYDGSISTTTVLFGTPLPKNWENTNSYRLGLTQKYDQWTAMAGLAYDETPVPDSTVSFELPDSDAWIFSVGGRYKIDEHWNVGMAALADLKKDRTVVNTNFNGEFSDSRAYLVTAGIEYRF